MKKKILVTKATIPPYEEYIEMIKPLWESHWITNMGKYHDQLEEELKKYLKVENISLMVNGHMALELCIQAMNFPKESEVITTPYTFVSTTHAIVRNNLKPVFCDIKESDCTIDEMKIEDLITDKTVAIVAVHVYGYPCNMKEIRRIANSYNLKVIYDAAHAFGVEVEGKGIGSFGDASVFSFHATKVFNTIEGGAITFKDKKLYDKLFNLKNFGIKSEELVMEVGTNAKLNEFQAAMGLCNLKYIKENIKKRKELLRKYKSNLGEIKGITFLKVRREVQWNYSYFPIFNCEIETGISRDLLIDKLRLNQIFPRKYFYPIIVDLECYKDQYSCFSLEIARRMSNNVILLPLYPDMLDEEYDRITQVLHDILN